MQGEAGGVPGSFGSTIDGNSRARAPIDAHEDRLRAKSKQNFMLNCQAWDMADDDGRSDDELTGNSLFLAIVEAHNGCAFEFLGRYGTDGTKRKIGINKIYYAREGGKGNFVYMEPGHLSDKLFDSDDRIDHQMDNFREAYRSRRLRIDKTGNKVKVTIAVKGFGDWSHTANYTSQYDASEVDYDQINFLDYLDKSTSVRIEMQ